MFDATGEVASAGGVVAPFHLEVRESHAPLDLHLSVEDGGELVFVITELMANVYFEGDGAVVEGSREAHISVPLDLMRIDELAGKGVLFCALVYMQAIVLI